MEIDKLDRAILLQLSLNSRLPTTLIAKAVRASREVVTYRMARLEKEGIIRGYVTDIPYERLGYIGAALFLSIKKSQEAAFEKYLAANKAVTWVARWSGYWTHGMSVIGKTIEEIDEHVKEITEKFANAIRESKFLIHKQSIYYPEKIFGGKFNPTKKKTPSLDQKDKLLLELISQNARAEAVQLAQELNLSAVAVANRIKTLEKNGIIRRYGLFIDLAKLGYKQYSVWIENKQVNERNRLLSLLANHDAVHMLFEYVGEMQIEFVVFVKDPLQVRTILMEIEEAFPDNRVLAVHAVHDDLISVAPPKCVFE